MNDQATTFVPGCETMTGDSTIGLFPAPTRIGRSGPKLAANPLERLVQLMQSNEGLMVDLGTSRERIVRARAYLDEPGCNVGFGVAHLDRCRSKHSSILAQLRANRIEALGLLAKDVVEG